MNSIVEYKEIDISLNSFAQAVAVIMGDSFILISTDFHIYLFVPGSASDPPANAHTYWRSGSKYLLSFHIIRISELLLLLHATLPSCMYPKMCWPRAWGTWRIWWTRRVWRPRKHGSLWRLFAFRNRLSTSKNQTLIPVLWIKFFKKEIVFFEEERSSDRKQNLELNEENARRYRITTVFIDRIKEVS